MVWKNGFWRGRFLYFGQTYRSETSKSLLVLGYTDVWCRFQICSQGFLTDKFKKQLFYFNLGQQGLINFLLTFYGLLMTLKRFKIDKYWILEKLIFWLSWCKNAEFPHCVWYIYSDTNERTVGMSSSLCPREY